VLLFSLDEKHAAGAQRVAPPPSLSPGASTISAAWEARLPGITRNPRPNRSCFLTNY